MAHGDAREGKWRGKWRMEWVVSTLRTSSEHVYPALLPLMRTPWLPVVDWTDTPADLNGLVRFAERRSLVSARVPSHFKRSLQSTTRGIIQNKLNESSKLLNLLPALYILMQKAVIRKFSAEQWIRSAWSVRPVLFWESAKLLWSEGREW
jgi:hypothetical protein